DRVSAAVPVSRREDAGADVNAFQAGASPNNTPVSSATAVVKNTTRRSGWTWKLSVRVRAPASSHDRTSAFAPKYAGPIPTRAPAADNNSDSVNSCLTSRDRLAPRVT